MRGARSPTPLSLTDPRLGPTEAIPEDAPLSPSFDARRYSHSSEDHERGLEDSLISLPGKSGALGKARTLANRIVVGSVTSATMYELATDTRLLYMRRVAAFTSLKSYVEVNSEEVRRLARVPT